MRFKCLKYILSAQANKKGTERGEGERETENVSHVGEALSNILSFLCQLTVLKRTVHC